MTPGEELCRYGRGGRASTDARIGSAQLRIGQARRSPRTLAVRPGCRAPLPSAPEERRLLELS